MFKAKKATKDERILDLETRCRLMGEAHEAFKQDMHRLMLEVADLMEGLTKRIETLEGIVAVLEQKQKPVISDLTAGGDKPLTAAQLMDEWLNGKEEGEDK